MSLPHTIELEVLKPDLHHGQPSEAIVKITPATLTNAPNAQPSTRFAYFNQPEKHIALKYASNVVVTSKYTLLNFFPKTLFLQFQRLANIFFVIVSALQVFTDLSPTGRHESLAYACAVLFLISPCSGSRLPVHSPLSLHSAC
jgi:hypothetical protein